MLAAVENDCRRTGCSMAQVALSWLRDRPTVSSVILGCRTLEQLEDNLGAAELDLTDEETGPSDRVSDPGAADYPYGGPGPAAAEPQDRGGAVGRCGSPRSHLPIASSRGRPALAQVVRVVVAGSASGTTATVSLEGRPLPCALDLGEGPRPRTGGPGRRAGMGAQHRPRAGRRRDDIPRSPRCPKAS